MFSTASLPPNKAKSKDPPKQDWELLGPEVGQKWPAKIQDLPYATNIYKPAILEVPTLPIFTNLYHIYPYFINVYHT